MKKTFYLLLLFTLYLPAQKIPDLPEATTVESTDEFPFETSAGTRKILWTNLEGKIIDSVMVLFSNVVNDSLVLSISDINIPDLDSTTTKIQLNIWTDTTKSYRSAINQNFNKLDSLAFWIDTTTALKMKDDTIYVEFSLADIQALLSNDFHNIGGTDDDVPDSGDLTVIDTEAKFESELFEITVPSELDYFTTADEIDPVWTADSTNYLSKSDASQLYFSKDSVESTFDAHNLVDIDSTTTITTGTTIDVAAASYIELNYDSVTTITDFTNATAGQRIVLVNVGSSAVTIQDGTNMMLSGSTDRELSTDDSIVLRYTSLGYFVEEGRDN